MRDMLRRALRWFSAAAAPPQLEIAVLKIHDLKYGITVDLDDGLATAIARGGWSQSPPNPLPGGLWGDVAEDIKIRLLTASNAVYSSLSFMAQRVEELQSPLHPDYLNPGAQIALEARTPDEATSRWALLKALAVDKLDPAHYRANGRSLLQIALTREGLWRGLEPGAAPLVLAPWSASRTALESLQFTNDAIGVSGTDDLLGDAPPLLIIKLRTYPDASSHIAILQESYPDSDVTAYDPFLWALNLADSPTLLDISSLTGTFSGADILPGGKCIELTDTDSPRWSVDLRKYPGYYTAYAVTLSNTVGTLQFFQQFDGESQYYPGEVVDVFNLGNNWIIHRLGTFRIPHAGETLRGNAPAATYYVGLTAGNDASGKLYLGGMFLQSENRPAQVVACYASGSPGPVTVADGELERVFWEDGSNNLVTFESPEIQYGPFQSVTPGSGVRNYLHLIPVSAPGNSYGRAPDMREIGVWGFGVNYIPRWKYLNQEGV